MSKQKYKLLTACIVSAINSSDVSQRGTVWEPVEVMDVQEADALEKIGYAEKTTSDVTAETKVASKTPIKPVTEPAKPELTPEDAAQAEADKKVLEFLGNKATDIIAAVEAATDEQKAGFPRMIELEKSNGNRSTVIAALEKAIAPAE